MGDLVIKIGNMEVLKLPEPGSIYRSFADEYERIGVGFMDKSGITRDLINFQPPTWSLIFVLRGKGRLEFKTGQRYELEANHCFIRYPWREHSGFVDPDSQWFEGFLDIGPKLATALIKARIIREEPLVWKWTLNSERLKRLCALRERLAVASEADLGACCVAIQDFIIESQRSAQHSNENDPIEDACHMLSQASLRRDNLRDWVNSRGLDYEKFRKAFKQRIGISPGQYRIRRRMDHACELLQHSDLSIAAIAYELGYPTPYEFSAQFKTQMGITPSHYRG